MIAVSGRSPLLRILALALVLSAVLTVIPRAVGGDSPRFTAADGELNRVYQDKRHRVAAAAGPLLVDAQRKWLDYYVRETEFATGALGEDRDTVRVRLLNLRATKLPYQPYYFAPPSGQPTAEARLQSAYDRLRARLKPADAARLLAAQRAWLTFRSAECTFHLVPPPTVPGFPIPVSVPADQTAGSLALERAEMLEDHLQQIANPSGAAGARRLEPDAGFTVKISPGGVFLDRGKKPVTTFNRHLFTNRGANVSPTGQLCFQGGILYDLRTGLRLVGPPDGTDEAPAGFDAHHPRYLGESMAFTPDDALALCLGQGGAGTGGVAKVLDLPGGQMLYNLDLPMGCGQPLASALGTDKRLAALATNLGLIVWTARTGGDARRLKFPVAVESVTFSPDGSTLTTTRRIFSEVCLDCWEVATGALRSAVRLPLHPGEIVVAGGGRAVGCWVSPEYPPAARDKGKWNIEQWDLATGRPLAPPLETGEAARQFNWPSQSPRPPWVLAPGGRWVVYAPEGDTGPMVVYDLDERREVARLRVVGPGVCDALPGGLTFSPDERFLVGSIDNPGDGRNMYPQTMPYDKVVLWDWQREGQVAQTIESRYLEASVVGFSPDGADMLVGYENGAVRVFDNATNRLSRTFELGTKEHFEHGVQEGFEGVRALDFSADGRWLLAEYPGERVNIRYGDTQFSVLDYRTGERVFNEAVDATCERRVARDNRHLILGQFRGMGGNHGRWDGTAERVRVLDLMTGRFVHWINGPMAADVSADGRWLATVRRDGRVELWDMTTGRLLDGVQLAHPFLSRDDFMVYANSLRFSGPGGLLAACVHDRLYLWHCEGGKLAADPALAAAFNARGYRTAHDPKTYAATADHLGEFIHGAEYLFSTGFHDGERYWDLWRLADGKLVRSGRAPQDRTPNASNRYSFTVVGDRLYLHPTSVPGRAADGVTVLVFPPVGTAGEVATERAAGLPGGGKNGGGRQFVSAGRRGAFVENAAVVCTDLDGTPVAVLHSFYPTGEAFVTPDNLYAASKDVLRRLGARYEGRLFPFEQFDLRFNRPDALAERFGAAAPDVAVLRQARERRLRRMGLTEAMLGDDWHLPEVAIDRTTIPLNAPEGQVAFDVRATDARYPLERINVYVNDVPLYGEAGLAVGPQGGAPGTPLVRRVTVPLSRGPNKIQVSAVNAQRSESLRETVTVSGGEGPNKSKRTLALVVVGVSKYLDADRSLEYADKDARDIAQYFENNHPGFDEVRTLRLLNADATREGLERARAFLLATGPDDRALVFLAGHGLLDAKDDYYFGTTDIDFAHPERRGASYEALNGLLDSIPAREKLLMMDTCHAGELDREEPILLAAASSTTADGRPTRGGVRRVRTAGNGPSLPTTTRPLGREALGEWFADLRRGTGATVIASSGGAEYANEDAEWRNGAFTYCVLNGLKSGAADLDGDGQTRVGELRDYVAREVRKLTDGEQSPVARRENLELNFVVAGNPQPLHVSPPPLEDADAAAARVNTAQCREFAAAYVHAYAGGAVDALVGLCGNEDETAGGPRMDGAAWRRRLDTEFARWPERQLEELEPPRVDPPGKGGTLYAVTLRLRCRLRNGAQTADETREVRLTLRAVMGRGVFLTDARETVPRGH